MIHLKPIIPKIVENVDNKSESARYLSSCSSDKEIMAYLSGKVDRETIKELFKQHYGIEYAEINNVDMVLIKQFSKDFLMNNKIIPISHNEEEDKLTMAISNLADRDLRGKIRRAVSRKSWTVDFKFAFESEIEEYLNNIFNSEEEVDDVKIKPGLAFDATEWVNSIIGKGIKLEASDIHIERLEKSVQVRYRVDGILEGRREFALNSNEISSIYVRLKIISNMDIVENRKSQDGRIDNYEYNGSLYDLRVNTVNTVYGEKVVMRIINKSKEVSTFEDLGFNEENKSKVVDMLKAKNGIIYLAGATGSGKSTTLYSMIEELNDERINIYTIEDPVEKTVNNVNQIQIDEASGTDYPSVLAALLRQDPDVIVVGEVRDVETAGLSIRASLTGHLVITTLHANNAVDSLSRLSDMGMESYLVGASSVGFLSQILIRKLCPHCKRRKEELETHEEIWLSKNSEGFDYSEEKAKGNYIYEPIGCEECSNGFKGRIALIEVLTVDDEIRSLISRGEDIDKIKRLLRERKYKTMKDDGIDKVKKGIISLAELIGKI